MSGRTARRVSSLLEQNVYLLVAGEAGKVYIAEKRSEKLIFTDKIDTPDTGDALGIIAVIDEPWSDLVGIGHR